MIIIYFDHKTGRIVAGITSFGMNPTCAGTGGVFRTDRTNVQNFVNQFLDLD